jgi:hypothetical protein
MDSIAEIIYNKLEPQVKSFCSKKYENMKQIFSAQVAPKKSKLADGRGGGWTYLHISPSTHPQWSIPMGESIGEWRSRRVACVRDVADPPHCARYNTRNECKLINKNILS